MPMVTKTTAHEGLGTRMGEVLDLSNGALSWKTIQIFDLHCLLNT